MKLKIFLLVLLLPNLSQASIPGLASSYLQDLLGLQARLMRVAPSSSTCPASLRNAAADGVLKIHYSFGYMDISSGSEGLRSPHSLYRVGDVLDGDARQAFESVLMMKCPPRSQAIAALRTCGFRRQGDRLVKTVQDRFSGRRLQVELRIDSSSVHSKNSLNTSRFELEQERKTKQTQARFHQALSSADAVFYLGHARSGGGPDFAPPRLTSSGRVDYPWYQSRQQNFRQMLSVLSQQSKDPAVLGLLACRSTPLFLRQTKQAATESLVITAHELFDYNAILPTALALTEALIRQSCGQEMEGLASIPAGAGFLSFR